MNQLLWTETIKTNSSPPWPCNSCARGTFALVTGSLIHKETVWSKRARKSDDWDPDWITYSFTAWVKCNNPACNEEAAVAGSGGVNYNCDEEGQAVERFDYFSPLFCTPMPDIFELPKKCPEEITSELRAAFALFWSDPSASANRVRVALEALMNHLQIQKRRKNKKGKFDKLNLHGRIKVFSENESRIGDQLMALKWLGNTGSHDGKVMSNDVLDAFEIIEQALLELVEHRSKRLAALAKGLTEKHDPRARKRKLLF
jgi:hypothetical protein